MPTIYKCPGCGAAMEFDSVTQKLGCPSCGMQIDVREYEEKYSQNSTQGEYDKEMKMYHCNTCGAELVADEYTSATFVRSVVIRHLWRTDLKVNSSHQQLYHLRLTRIKQ